MLRYWWIETKETPRYGALSGTDARLEPQMTGFAPIADDFKPRSPDLREPNPSPREICSRSKSPGTVSRVGLFVWL